MSISKFNSKTLSILLFSIILISFNQYRSAVTGCFPASCVPCIYLYYVYPIYLLYKNKKQIVSFSNKKKLVAYSLYY